MKKIKKVWIGYGVMFEGDLLTHRDTGQLAIFSNLEVAQASLAFKYSQKVGIVKLYMRLEGAK